VLTPAEAAAAFDTASLPQAEARRPVWEYLIRWMLLLFLLDVAVRRIAINPIEIARKLRRFIGEMAGKRQPAEASAAVLSTLKGTRAQVRDDLREQATEAGPAPDRSARYEPTVPDSKVTEQLSEALDGASELERPVVARPTKKKVQTSEADFTSRLLQAKKRARDRMKGDDQDKNQ
jgi:hypothetical protein